MKYVSLVVVVLFIAFTAWFAKRTEDLSIDQMNKMNNLIAQYMTQAVQTHNPNATEIDFSKVETEVIEKGKQMKAHFSFSYMEPNADGQMEKVYRKGTFLITSDDGQKWTAQIERAGDVKVEFLEPFAITDEGVEPIPQEPGQDQGGESMGDSVPEAADGDDQSNSGEGEDSE